MSTPTFPWSHKGRYSRYADSRLSNSFSERVNELTACCFSVSVMSAMILMSVRE